MKYGTFKLYLFEAHCNNEQLETSLRKDVSLEADIGPHFEFASFSKGINTIFNELRVKLRVTPLSSGLS